MTPIDCSSPGSPVHGNLQIRILECIAISFFEGSSWPRDQIQVSCISRQILYCLSHQGSLYGFYTPLLYIHTHTYTQGASLSCPCKGRIPVFFHHQESDQFPLFRDHLSIWRAALRKTQEPHFSQYEALSFQSILVVSPPASAAGRGPGT